MVNQRHVPTASTTQEDAHGPFAKEHGKLRGDQMFDRLWETKRQKTVSTVEDQDRILRRTNLTRVTQKEAYDIFEPVINCEDEVRLGTRHHNIGDGPKFVCGLHLLKLEPACLIYSIGSNWDFTFELAVLKVAPQCIIHTFDGTMDLKAKPLPKLPRNIIFHNWNIIADCEIEGKQEFQSRCVESVIKELKTPKDRLTWLKIDCEGCEFDVMPVLLKALRVQHLLIEVHDTDVRKITTLFRLFTNSGLLVFHKERNQWGCDGYRCVEFSLMNFDYAKIALALFVERLQSE